MPWIINNVHKQLGHQGKDTTQDIVKGLNLNFKPGEMETCWACMVAKAKQKNVVQFSLHKKSQVPGARVFLDLSSMEPPAGLAELPRANWIMVVVECSNFNVSHFFHRKYQMAQAMCELLKNRGIITKFVWIMYI